MRIQKKFSYGNIVDNTLEEILLRQRSSKLSNRSIVLFNGECSGCKYWSICHGGCPHDALSYSHNYLNKTLLCSAYKRLFAHISSKISNGEVLVSKSRPPFAVNEGLGYFLSICIYSEYLIST